MSGPYECGYIAGRCDHPECGELMYGGPVPEQQPEPTVEDYCADGGHGYYGDDGDVGRCYCGEKRYPKGGPEREDA